MLTRTARAQAGRNPNIVFVLADDLGWTGLGCFGSDFYETPNIDRLAREGMRFDHGYATAMHCAPSRACIMSGQYTSRHRVMYVSHYQDRIEKSVGHLKRFKLIMPRRASGLSNEIATIAESLKKAGYATGMFGKWHLGKGDQHPSKRGFDEAIESSGKHFGFTTDPPVEHDPDQYLSDFLGDWALAFIEGSHKAGKPFFLYLSDFLVHGPLEAKQEYLDHFSAKKPGEKQHSPVAAAMVKGLDDTVGRVMDKLAELGIADDTLVVFTSDNGGLKYKEDGERDANTSNWPLRAGKGSEFDGGFRVPYIFRWPGKIPAGTTNHTPITNVDLYPTLLAAAGANRPDQPLDGVDLSAILHDAGAQLAQRDIFWYLPLYSSFNRPSVVIRRGEWKLIHLLESGDFELYNTEKDIGEKNNLAAQHPELAQNMNRRALQWLDDTDAPRMTPNSTYDPEWRK